MMNVSSIFKWQNESGHGLIELAITIPLLLSLTFGITEFVVVFNKKHEMGMLARQTAMLVNHHCFDELIGEQTALKTCLESAGNAFTDVFQEKIIPESYPDWDTAGQLSLSIYTKTSPTQAVRQTTFTHDGNGARSDASNFETKVSGNDSRIATHANLTGLVTVAEVFYNYKPVTPFGRALGLGGIYEVHSL